MRLSNSYNRYINKLEIIPNLSKFNGFNRSRAFLYAGSLSLVNNANVIDGFIKNIVFIYYLYTNIKILKNVKKYVYY